MRLEPSYSHVSIVPSAFTLSEVSANAKELMNHFLLFTGPKSPELWVHQKSFASLLKISKRTFKRYLKELIGSGFLIETGKLHPKGYKFYAVSWLLAEAQNSDSNENSSSDEKSEKEDQSKKGVTNLRGGGDKSAPPPVTNLALHKQNNLSEQLEQIFNESAQHSILVESEDKKLKMLLENFGEEWRENFPCFDGKSGRPTLEEQVEEGLCRNADAKPHRLRALMNGWLRRGAKYWANSARNTNFAPAAIGQSLEELAERKAKIEKEQEERDAFDAEAQRMRTSQQVMPESEPETEEQAKYIAEALKVDKLRDWRKERASRKLTNEELNARKKGNEVLPSFMSMKPEQIKEKYRMSWDLMKMRLDVPGMKAA